MSMKPGKFKVFAGITPYLDGVFLIAYANHHPGCLFCVLFCASFPLLKKAHLAVVLFSFFLRIFSLDQSVINAADKGRRLPGCGHDQLFLRPCHSYVEKSALLDRKSVV